MQRIFTAGQMTFEGAEKGHFFKFSERGGVIRVEGDIFKTHKLRIVREDGDLIRAQGSLGPHRVKLDLSKSTGFAGIRYDDPSTPNAPSKAIVLDLVCKKRLEAAFYEGLNAERAAAQRAANPEGTDGD